MDFEKLLKELKEEIVNVATSKFGNQASGIITDMNSYLESSKEKLKKWTLLFAGGSIDKDEFEWLLKSQKDLLVLKTLQQAGISNIKLGHFKNKIINIIIDKAVTLIL